MVATTNQLISLPKRLLDPRRPVIPAGGKLKGDDKEEGLVAYDAAIPDERKWTISHVNEVTPQTPHPSLHVLETSADGSYSASQK